MNKYNPAYCNHDVAGCLGKDRRKRKKLSAARHHEGIRKKHSRWALTTYPECASQSPCDEISIATQDPTSLFKNAHFRGPSSPLVIKHMIVGMMDANYISERLSSLKQEMRDLRVFNARYWSHSTHTALDKSYRALNQQRLLQIKWELSDLMKRCA